MVADADIQVWLEAVAQSRPSVIVPVVQSAVDKQVDYRVRVIREREGGRSEVSQGGTVFMPAATPTPLGRMSVSLKDGDICEIELTFLQSGKLVDERRFDCPR